MPAISKDLDLAATGHLCWSVVPVEASQFSVKANGIPILRPGDWCSPHTIKCGPACCGHPAQINRGSSSVFAVGIPVARIGDSTDFGAMIEGSNNVFAGG